MTTAPTSQKERPIGFYLVDARGSGRKDKAVSLRIRPEDLSRTEPSRMTTHQTLGSVSGPSGWVDNFGPGLQTINISGHTGWGAIGGDKDGAARFTELYEEIFKNWHKYRQDAIASGNNPDDVELIFIDNLDNFACVVSPTSFNLRRNKARPLLMQYQISMTVLAQRLGAVNLLNAPAAATTVQLGLDSLFSSIKKLTDFLGTVKKWIDTTILGPVKSFLKMTTDVLNAVKSVYGSIAGITASLIDVARSIVQAGRNIFQTLAAIANLPSTIKMSLMQVASEFGNVFCLLRNALKAPSLYPDYSGLYGASNCSSTAGGSGPSLYAGQNPFYAVAPVVVAPVVVVPAAQASLKFLGASDPVLAPLSPAAMAPHIGTIATGVRVA